MGISREELKSQAKITIRETKPSPILVSVVYTAILVLFSILLYRILGIDHLGSEEYIEIVEQLVSDGDFHHVLDQYLDFSTQAILLQLAIRVVSVIVSAGFSIYCLRISRKIESSVGTLLDGFGMILKILGITILQSVFIFLWSLLFVFPGIIALYRYSQALYLQLDHPDWSPLECIRTSKQMMRGRKMELFVLEVSFILWSLLAGLSYIGIFISIWLYIYKELTLVNYYNTLLKNLSMQCDQDKNSDTWINHN